MNMNTNNVSTPSTSSGTMASSSSGASGSGNMVTGLFPDRASAEAAYNAAHSRGYSKDDVNLVMSDDTRKRHFSDDSAMGKETELGNKAAKGAGIGGALGGTIGAVLAGIAAVGTSIALPGVGLVIAGPLAAAAAGAGAGAASGGLLGALIGWNMPEERVKDYEEGVNQGGILMGVRTKNDDDAMHFENEWKKSGGERIYR